MPLTRYICDFAWIGGDTAAADVLIEVGGERITTVTPGVAPMPDDAIRLRGLTLPGFANAHSHAFHRALRGHAQRGGGTFWTWRDIMYDVAARLTPDTYFDLARATYAEMVCAGFTAVGEFHYLHHPAAGRYDDPNAMGEALIAAARDAGIRITLLDTCYLAAGPGRGPAGVQTRFSDGEATAWASRAGRHGESAGARIGAAIHSMRAVPPAEAAVVAQWAHDRGAPLHFHLSEQPAENDAVRAHYGSSPAAMLAQAGALGEHSTAIHATHLSDDDISELGRSRTGVCLCPTTERDLADGIGPAPALAGAGSPLALGTDGHAVIDPFEESRALELDERLASRRRGHWTAAGLLTAATAGGHRAIGWTDAGRIEPGALADLVTIDLSSSRLAGWDPGCLLESAVFAASAADVDHVVVSGRTVVESRRHRRVEDVGRALRDAIARLPEA